MRRRAAVTGAAPARSAGFARTVPAPPVRATTACTHEAQEEVIGPCPSSTKPDAARDFRNAKAAGDTPSCGWSSCRPRPGRCAPRCARRATSSRPCRPGCIPCWRSRGSPATTGTPPLAPCSLIWPDGQEHERPRKPVPGDASASPPSAQSSRCSCSPHCLGIARRTSPRSTACYRSSSWISSTRIDSSPAEVVERPGSQAGSGLASTHRCRCWHRARQML